MAYSPHTSFVNSYLTLTDFACLLVHLCDVTVYLLLSAAFRNVLLETVYRLGTVLVKVVTSLRAMSSGQSAENWRRSSLFQIITQWDFAFWLACKIDYHCFIVQVVTTLRANHYSCFSIRLLLHHSSFVCSPISCRAWDGQ